MTLTDIKLAGVVSLLSTHLVAIWDIVIVSEGLGKKLLIVLFARLLWILGVCVCVCVCSAAIKDMRGKRGAPRGESE